MRPKIFPPIFIFEIPEARIKTRFFNGRPKAVDFFSGDGPVAADFLRVSGSYCSGRFFLGVLFPQTILGCGVVKLIAIVYLEVCMMKYDFYSCM